MHKFSHFWWKSLDGKFENITQSTHYGCELEHRLLRSQLCVLVVIDPTLADFIMSLNQAEFIMSSHLADFIMSSHLADFIMSLNL